MEKPSTTEVIGAVVLGVLLVVLLAQGQRIWEIIERVVKVETKVELYHYLDEDR